MRQWERPGGGPASQWEPAAAVPQAGYDGACYGGEAGGGATGGEAGGGGERQQQDQLFHTLEAQFERSRARAACSLGEAAGRAAAFDPAPRVHFPLILSAERARV